MKWLFWKKGPIVRSMDIPRPLLASWDKASHPSQIRLRAYREEIVRALLPLPVGATLFLDMEVDVERPEYLLCDHDLENYLTPLFGTQCLPARRFVLVTAHKRVGGGSRISYGEASASDALPDSSWFSFNQNAGAGTSERRWKERLRAGLAESLPRVVPPGPVRVRLAWRCSCDRNWVGLWKPTADAMGPVLGASDPGKPFNPRDDRILDLELHLNSDNTLRHDVVVGMWWRAA